MIEELGPYIMGSIRQIPHRKFLIILSVLFLIEFIFLAIEPYDRKDWALENVLVIIAAIVIIASYKHLLLSRVSYFMIFVFLLIHEIGSHYTYANVPYDLWFKSLFGVTFNEIVGWERNNFDRVVHFLYGLLLAYPIREIYFRIADAKGFWCYFLPLNLTMSTSLLFELFEWAAAEIFGGDLGVAYLGTQGDIWDAHKDMALAGAGALITMLIILLINYYLQKDFAREWSRSLEVKHKEPLGEDELARMMEKND